MSLLADCSARSGAKAVMLLFLLAFKLTWWHRFQRVGSAWVVYNFPGCLLKFTHAFPFPHHHFLCFACFDDIATGTNPWKRAAQYAGQSRSFNWIQIRYRNAARPPRLLKSFRKRLLETIRNIHIFALANFAPSLSERWEVAFSFRNLDKKSRPREITF